MARRPSILIVSASAGTGHLRAADALREHVNAYAPLARVEHIDILQLAPRWVRRAYGGGFELIAARAPWMWRELYALTDGRRSDHARWGPLAQRLVFREFRRFAGSSDWDIVLCTHFLPCQLAAGRRGFPPFSLVVTDYTLHRYWVQPGVSRYFVASERQAAELRARTVAPVVASGIPVMPSFAGARCDRGSVTWREHRRTQSLDTTAPVVLVMGGGLGLGVEEMTDAALATGINELQLVVVCGRNGAARQRLEARHFDDARVRVLGHVHNVEQLMAAADVVVTKPGGLTTTESLVVGRPLVLTRPLPGHEVGNVRELERSGAALAAHDAAAVTHCLQRLFGEPALLREMTFAAASASRADAGYDIAEQVLHLAQSRVAA